MRASDPKATPTSNALLEVIAGYNERNLQRALDAVAEDCEAIEVPTGEVFDGRTGVKAEFERWSAAMSDGHQEVLNMIEVDDWVIVEGILGGTHDGPLDIGDRTIPASGRRIAFPFCTVAQVRDGQEQRTKHYYDFGTILRQVGDEGTA